MKNAIYLQYEWFSGEVTLTDSDRNNHILTLQDHGINQQFCDIGVIQDNGTLLAEGYAKLDDWIQMSRLVDPGQKIILVLNHGRRASNPKFGTVTFRNNLNKTVKNLINAYAVDGIHLDIERFMNNDTKLLAILKTLKTTLGTSHLSIATPVTVWSDVFITQVAQVVDQMNPMVYDTMGWGSWVVDEASYQSYFKNVITRYSSLLANLDCELVPTLPSYELRTAEDGTIYHDPKVENMKAAIAALNEAIAEGVLVNGAGIFWGSFYLGLYPNVYDGYIQDQEEWKANWLKII
jgi:hypothetical protein